ncbi:AAA family ATPase [Frigidibacter sp. MR17.14]|uniref:AAA family ATPase n=1 Tax=Frigidibacter sp. MR17.14 TaxID=3126509 RepID=UPI00301313D0
MKRSLILVTDDGAIAETLRGCLSDRPGVEIEVQPGALSRINGTAVLLAQTHDIVMFRVAPDAEADAEAIRRMRAEVTGPCTLVALADTAMPLGQAKALERAGVDEILPLPLAPAEVAGWIDAWERRRTALALSRPAESERLGKIVSVMPARGGIGATTVAVNLADQLVGRSGFRGRKVEGRVALIDLDLQFGAVASALDLEPNDALARMATGAIIPDAAFLRDAMVEHPSGLHVLTAPEQFLPMDAVSRAQVDALLREARRQFDHVVVDVPRTLVDWISPVLRLSDRTMLVTDSTVPSIRQSRRLIDFFTEEVIDLKIDVVVNHEARPMFKGRHHAEAAKILGRPLKHWLPHDARAARQALDRGETLAASAGRAPLARAIRTMARSLSETQAADTRH